MASRSGRSRVTKWPSSSKSTALAQGTLRAARNVDSGEMTPSRIAGEDQHGNVDGPQDRGDGLLPDRRPFRGVRRTAEDAELPLDDGGSRRFSTIARRPGEEDLLGTDMPASSAITQELLAWKPTHPGLIEDIGQGHYFT